MKLHAWFAFVVVLLVPASPLRAQSVECDTPALQTPSPFDWVFLGIAATSGNSLEYRTARHRCDLLVEKGPRAMGLYRHCPNLACQLGLERNGFGVVTAVEKNLLANLTACLPANCDTWFGLKARTGFRSVEPGRGRVSGWHQLAFNLFGATLGFPVHPFEAERTQSERALALQATYGVPFYAARWRWDERYAKLVTQPIPIPPIGTLEISLQHFDQSPPGERLAQDGAPFYALIQSTDAGDYVDWDWYLSPSQYWSPLQFRSRDSLDFDIAPYASSFDFPGGTARLSAFATGEASAVFRHSEARAWTEVSDPALPSGLYYRRGALTTKDSESIVASMTAGVRITVRLAWFTWRDQWSLPALRGTTISESPSRESSYFQVLARQKTSDAAVFTACTAVPPAVVPRWVTDAEGSPVPPPDEPTGGDLPEFTRVVGQAVVDSFTICPTAAGTSADREALEAIRRTYLADKLINPSRARQVACESLTRYLRRMLTLCGKGRRGEAVSLSSRYRRGTPSCTISI